MSDRTYHRLSERPQPTIYVLWTTEQYNNLAECIMKNDSTWLSRFVILVRHYYEQHCSGGNLHIVLDDGNLSRENIAWCAGMCHGLEDNEGSDIAELMRLMTYGQRQKVYRNIHK